MPPVPRPVQDPAQLIIDQQRGQARQRQLEQPPASITIVPTSETTLDIPVGTPIDEIIESGPTFPVQRIALQGEDGKPFVPPGGISRKRLNEVIGPFVNHDLGSHRINVLLKRLTGVFVEGGFVTTRALLGSQNLATGTINVTVQVGRIASFMADGKPKAGESSVGGGWLTDAGYENAFPAASGGGVTPESISLSNDGNGPRAIVKVDAKRPMQVLTFETAKPVIQQQLQVLALEKASADFVGRLMKGAAIQQ
ncbi:hypothetical protein G3O06_03550 [Burkholderia sp. Ac-20345]|nr:hypothetical protein [Burkholderia sp. Ac-20345]